MASGFNLRPDVMAGRTVDERCTDPDALTALPHAALDDVSRLELAAYLLHICGIAGNLTLNQLPVPPLCPQARFFAPGHEGGRTHHVREEDGGQAALLGHGDIVLGRSSATHVGWSGPREEG